MFTVDFEAFVICDQYGIELFFFSEFQSGYFMVWIAFDIDYIISMNIAAKRKALHDKIRKLQLNQIFNDLRNTMLGTSQQTSPQEIELLL